MIRVGTDCSGIEAPVQALIKLGLDYHHVFACDIDKYVKKVSQFIYKPDIWYDNLMERDNITNCPEVDLYVAGFPCQAFSLAGKRKGFDDIRGSVFFGVADYIRHNRPKVFILENVKGLLSHDKGRTWQTVLDVLGGNGTVNGQMSIPYYEDGLDYHIYHTVLNTKDFGVPQNRERVFIVGFREEPKQFRFPLPVPLELRLKDLLEEDVDEKYYLSEHLAEWQEGHRAKRGSEARHKTGDDIADCLNARYFKAGAEDQYIKDDITLKQVGELDIDGHDCIKRIYDPEGLSPTVPTASGGGHLPKIKVDDEEWVQLTEQRTEEAKKIRSENLKRGKDYSPRRGKELVEREDGMANTVTSTQGKEQLLANKSHIRRLTPLECFRLQGYPDSFHQQVKDLGISDTQRYKMAGNSITVDVMAAILAKIYAI